MSKISCGVCYAPRHTFCNPRLRLQLLRLGGLGSPLARLLLVNLLCFDGARSYGVTHTRAEGVDLCGCGIACQDAREGHDLGSFLVTWVHEQHAGGQDMLCIKATNNLERRNEKKSERWEGRQERKSKREEEKMSMSVEEWCGKRKRRVK